MLSSATAVNDAVSAILSHARGDEVKAEEIVGGIMQHSLMKDHLESYSCNEHSKSGRLRKMLSDDIIAELLNSIDKLKKGARNTPEWVAYRCILHATVPAKYPHPQLLSNFISSHFTTVAAASRRKEKIVECGDWSIGTVADLRRDAFRVKYKSM